MTRCGGRALFGLFLVFALTASSRAQSQAPGLLDVPFLSQTPALCGGAAVAMVLRYWGQRDVFPQDFASLVSQDGAGILTSVLPAAVRDRGWRALVVPASPETARQDFQSQIDRGRPMIALVEVAPRAYHYVVIVGVTNDALVLHDPARAPFRVVGWAEFDRAWTAAGRWMMLVLPPEDVTPGSRAATGAPSASVQAPVEVSPCGALVEQSVSLALANDEAGAEQGLVAATRICPNHGAAWRELAGLRFSHSRWTEAQALAATAVRVAPDDAYAWQLLATSRYLVGDATGALEAWNHVNEPRMDQIDVHGADRTPHMVIVRASGLAPRAVLTPATLARAERRLRALPVASNARVRYEPVPGDAAGSVAGLAKVDVFIDERPLVPHGLVSFATIGARAWLLDELRISVAGPFHAADLESVAWRWSPERPRVSFGLAFPSPSWLPGVVAFDWSTEHQSYVAPSSSTSTDDTVSREARRRAALHLSDWWTGWLRWEIGGAFDRFDGATSFAVDGSLDVRLAGDRAALVMSVASWMPVHGGDRFSTTELLTAWRSTTDATRPVWSAAGEVSRASLAAPRALWQGAGDGHGRSGLLRAHPLLEGGVLSGPAFGREVAHGTVEYARPVKLPRAIGLSIAAFVDGARAWDRQNGLASSPLFVDAGIGVRVRAPGAGGSIRIDVAHGLRGGGTALSATWGTVWPR